MTTTTTTSPHFLEAKAQALAIFNALPDETMVTVLFEGPNKYGKIVVIHGDTFSRQIPDPYRELDKT